MTITRRAIIASIVVAAVPVVVALALWAAGVGSGGIAGDRAGGEALAEVQETLYLYEEELADLDWRALAGWAGHGTDGDAERLAETLSEMELLGYHVQVRSGPAVLFANLDESDLSAVEGVGAFSEGAARIGTATVLRSTVERDGAKFELVAVYDPSRAGAGMDDAVLPAYLVTQPEVALLLMLVIAGVCAAAAWAAWWMHRSVTRPLAELTAGLAAIERGEAAAHVGFRDDEFGPAFEAFEGMSAQLARAEEERASYEAKRAELVAGVSHDLRTPLTTIRGYAEGLRDGIADTPERRERYCQAILTRTADLERLACSLADLSGTEAAPAPEMRPTSLDAFLRGAMEERRGYLEDNGLRLGYRNDCPGATVGIDAAQMGRVLDNLLANTVRHRTSGESHAELSVGRDGHMARVRFADDGPGVDAGQLASVFDAFWRSDAARAGEGSGLGLAIVRGIVEAHGGSVGAFIDDELGGLAVEIGLPIVEEAT